MLWSKFRCRVFDFHNPCSADILHFMWINLESFETQRFILLLWKNRYVNEHKICAMLLTIPLSFWSSIFGILFCNDSQLHKEKGVTAWWRGSYRNQCSGWKKANCFGSTVYRKESIESSGIGASEIGNTGFKLHLFLKQNHMCMFIIL